MKWSLEKKIKNILNLTVNQFYLEENYYQNMLTKSGQRN